MDGLRRTRLLDELTGRVFLHQYEAMEALDGPCASGALEKTAGTTEPGTSPCPSQRLAGIDPAR